MRTLILLLFFSLTACGKAKFSQINAPTLPEAELLISLEKRTDLPNCKRGLGTQISFGHDLNANEILDEEEVEQVETVCQVSKVVVACPRPTPMPSPSPHDEESSDDDSDSSDDDSSSSDDDSSSSDDESSDE